MNRTPNGARAIGLSKTRLLSWRQCPKRLWLDVNLAEKPPVDAGTELVFRQGHEVGAAARSQFEDGVLISPENDLGTALAQTAEALGGRSRCPLFEATFERDGVLVRVDVLEPARGGAWLLHEVKSASSVKDYHLQDIAVQRWVLQASGLKFSAHTLMHVDSTWIYPGDGAYDGLFANHDLSAETAPLQSEVGSWVAGARATLVQDEPDIGMGEQCIDPYPCPYQEHCASRAGVVEYPVMLLPGAGGKSLARRLAEQGFADLRDVPEQLVTDPQLALVHRVTRSGTAYFDSRARDEIAHLPWPRAYLDFETMNFAVPRWAGTKPYQQVPFQWSCHIETSRDRFAHAEFLDLSGGDPRRACAEQLVAALRGVKVILVYSAAFERGRMRELAEAFPDLADELNDAIGKIFDLLPLVRQFYYHRDMRGSRSLKAVLPTILDGDPYAALERVRDGSSAQLAYVEAIDAATCAARRESIERQLRAYCRVDSWAMIALGRFLERKPLPSAPLT